MPGMLRSVGIIGMHLLITSTNSVAEGPEEAL